jgi:hypothetical protein
VKKKPNTLKKSMKEARTLSDFGSIPWGSLGMSYQRHQEYLYRILRLHTLLPQVASLHPVRSRRLAQTRPLGPTERQIGK